MIVRTGTSGFSYKAWKGAFYPQDLSDKEMLSFYAQELGTVEINNTFYRMPRASVLEGWREKVPEGFVFVIKASQRITHRARLKEAGESVQFLWDTVQALGSTLGPLLFQLPPNFKQDLERLDTFLAELPEGLRAAFEFRHPSWTDEETSEGTLEVLRRHGAAHCIADIDPKADKNAEDSEGADAPELVPVDPPSIVATADWGYLRLRRETYTEADLIAWTERVLSQPWREAFVFFKHDGEEAWSARRARRMAELWRAREPDGKEGA